MTSLRNKRWYVGAKQAGRMGQACSVASEPGPLPAQAGTCRAGETAVSSYAACDRNAAAQAPLRMQIQRTETVSVSTDRRGQSNCGAVAWSRALRKCRRHDSSMHGRQRFDRIGRLDGCTVHAQPWPGRCGTVVDQLIARLQNFQPAAVEAQSDVALADRAFPFREFLSVLDQYQLVRHVFTTRGIVHHSTFSVDCLASRRASQGSGTPDAGLNWAT